MRSNERSLPWLAAIVALTVSGILSNTGHAHEYTIGSLRIEEPWSRATTFGMSVAVAYMRIENTGKRADRLLGGRSPVAQTVDLHRPARRNDGTTTMVRQKDGVTVPAGETITFAPDAYHVKLLGLTRPLEPESVVPLTLRFARAGTIDIGVLVQPLMARAPSDE